MGEDPQVPGEWDPTESGEPPAQLLRRAISHVESLLHRLEPAVDAAELDTQPDAGAVLPEVVPAADDIVVPAAHFTPLPTVSSAEKAEALRITLHAHEEAHRLQSEANALRAAAAADGEQMLLEARTMSDRVHVEARESATALLEAAQRESRALLDAARAEATSIRQRAVADHDTRRAEYDALAEQERAAALDEANVIIEQAEREAERIRAEARADGLAQATREAREQVADAVAEVRQTMHSLLQQVGAALSSFDDAVAHIALDPGETTTAPGPTAVPAMPGTAESEPHGSALATQQAAAPTPAPASERQPAEARRPLGLLFGAQRS